MKQIHPKDDGEADFTDFVLELEDMIDILKGLEAGKPKKSISLRLTEDDLDLIEILYERTCCVMDLMPERAHVLGETKYPSKQIWLKAALYAGLCEFRERCRMFREKYD